MRAVEAAGGLPVVLARARPEDVAELLDRLQGLVLSGGADVDPARYGETPHRTVTDVTAERDALRARPGPEALDGTCPLSLSAGANRC